MSAAGEFKARDIPVESGGRNRLRILKGRRRRRRECLVVVDGIAIAGVLSVVFAADAKGSTVVITLQGDAVTIVDAGAGGAA